jgi:copper(I)-binding protein
VAGCRSPRGGTAAAANLVVSHAVVPLPPSPVEASAFLVLENRSATPNALTGSQSPVADSVVMHEMTGGRMTRVTRIEIPAHGRVALVPGSYHLMLAGIRRPLAIGDTVPIVLRFASGEAVTVRAPVLRYTDAVNDLPEP